jgi:WD40 repeat protein
MPNTLTMPKTMTWWFGGYLYVSTHDADGFWCSVVPSPSGNGPSRDFQTESLACLSPSGELFISRDEDHIVQVRNVNEKAWKAGDVLFSCQKLSSDDPILGYAWSHGSKLAAIQLSDGSIHCYQMQSGWGNIQGQERAICHLGSPLTEWHAMQFSPDEKRIAVASASGVKIYNALKSIEMQEVGQGQVTSIAWSPDGRYLALGRRDSILAVYLVGWSGRMLREWTRHTASVSALAWSPGGDFLVSGDRDGNVLLWGTTGNPKNWSLIDPVEDESADALSGIEAIAWSPDGQRCALLDAHNKLDTFTMLPQHS